MVEVDVEISVDHVLCTQIIICSISLLQCTLKPAAGSHLNSLFFFTFFNVNFPQTWIMWTVKVICVCIMQERAALKKLDNVKKDHEKRICELQKEQVWASLSLETGPSVVTGFARCLCLLHLFGWLQHLMCVCVCVCEWVCACVRVCHSVWLCVYWILVVKILVTGLWPVQLGTLSTHFCCYIMDAGLDGTALLLLAAVKLTSESPAGNFTELLETYTQSTMIHWLSL